MTFSMLMGCYIFALSCVAGYQLIAKVPPTLHTPLMSGANAISGVTILGAMTMAALMGDSIIGHVFALLAVVFATINVVGGFLVTDRMLRMFSNRRGRK